jgi:DNA mismatch repair protein MutS
MALDLQTRRNLELFVNARTGDNTGSMLSVLDTTKTAMGARLLKRWIGQPVIDIELLKMRHEAVDWFYQNAMVRHKLISLVAHVMDLERLINRVRSNIATPRDLIALRSSLENIPDIKAEIDTAPSLEWLSSDIKHFPDVVALIAQAISDEPGASLERGGVIKEGFSEELDTVRRTSVDSKKYLANIEREERENTGIKSLKVGYNRVFGYYIEVSNANLDLVPERYIRKQTLTNGERFFTPELKEYESLILNAQERMIEIETDLFDRVCQQVATASEQILMTANAIAYIDVFCSLADTAVKNAYVRPELTDDDVLEIRGGRHPVVEKSLGAGMFVPNDSFLSNQDTQLIILTGPNMAGKSTYLKQVALIVLMAQIGSFVPADSAHIGIVDRIFTRIGAQEDLASGQSTFMVEMIEAANILNNATAKSLVILDEVGRGTSTYDGLSIAWAVAEFIHNSPVLRSKTLFATHYHELVELAGLLPRVKNFNVSVTEEKGKVIFLRKVVQGGADKSYGIHVAQLAGLPMSVVHRAQEVLAGLENTHSPQSRRQSRSTKLYKDDTKQMSFFDNNQQIVDELLKLDIDSMTPLEAITLLYSLKKKAGQADSD